MKPACSKRTAAESRFDRPERRGKRLAASFRAAATRITWLLLGALAFCTPAFAYVDFSGSWAWLQQDWRGVEPLLGDYTGLPINDAARLRGDTYSPDTFTVPEHQCMTHPVDYVFLLANMRVWADDDPATQLVTAIHQTTHFGIVERTIWMDGRPQPSKYAPYSTMGFSTGRWDGDTLVVTDTHVRAGFLRRNGVPRSESAKITEYWMRDDDLLTVVVVVDDPKFLTEPLVRSSNFAMNPGYLHEPSPCSARVETVRPPGYVAYYLPGQNDAMADARRSSHLPLEALRGGARTTTPEFARELRALAFKRWAEKKRESSGR